MNMNGKGKVHNERISTVILNEIIDSTDPISYILNKREEWNQSFDPNILKGNRSLNSTAVDLTDPLPRWAKPKIESS